MNETGNSLFFFVEIRIQENYEYVNQKINRKCTIDISLCTRQGELFTSKVCVEKDQL